MSDPISSVTSGASANYADRVPVQKLDQKDFLKLLVAQLTTQDPMNPQKDTEFIGQMAQFSALENSKSMQNDIQTLRAGQLLGQTVQIKIADEQDVVGQVSAIDTTTGEAKIIVNDHAYALSDVMRVQQQSSTSKPNTPS